MTPPAAPERYKNHRFPGEIIRHGVWLYSRFPLSYRDVQELLFERGIDVTHEGPNLNGIQLSVTSSILIFYGESFRMRFQEDL